MRIPISAKIIGITTLIIVVSLAIVTQQSSEFLRKVMVQREEYSNLSEATLRSDQVNILLNASLDKAKTVAQSIMSESAETLPQYTLPKDKHLISVEIWQLLDGQLKLYTRKQQNSFAEKNKLDLSFIEELRKKKPYPLNSVLQKNIEIQFAEYLPSVRLISIGFPLGKDAQGQVNTLAVATFDSEMIQSLFSEQTERELFLVDRSGQLLAHQNPDKLSEETNLSSLPLVAKAIADNNLKRQVTLKDKKTKEIFIGAFVKNPTWGVSLLAQTPMSIVVEPAIQVQRKAILIAGIAISISLFAVFLFSLTITKPIETLAELIQEIPKGNFNISAKTKVKSKDEVGDLAEAFDHMTEGLRERDKVKNLFSKFHGSSITENLLSQEVSVGGTRKEVTVFFSDIRGFTKFSEGHTPEEVVTMLNEYFAVMVKIINDHGGVVDKFIGDAIMAVWGVPQPTPQDTENAMKACLAMRKGLKELNQSRLERGLVEIHIGMGLHAGPAISGTIGSEERMEFTVIGDTVNVTSRIESSTKHFEVDLLVSDEVYARLNDQDNSTLSQQFKFELAGDIEVKGKSLPLRLYKYPEDVQAG